MRTEGGKGVVHTKLVTRQSLRSTKLKSCQLPKHSKERAFKVSQKTSMLRVS